MTASDKLDGHGIQMGVMMASTGELQASIDEGNSTEKTSTEAVSERGDPNSFPCPYLSAYHGLPCGLDSTCMAVSIAVSLIPTFTYVVQVCCWLTAF